MEKQIQKIKNKLKASALVVTMIILGIMLVSALSMALVAVQERKASMGENTSNQAYNKAEDGVEKVMQAMKDHAGDNLLSIGCSGGIITSTEGYTVKFKDATDSFITDCGASISSVKSVKSIGTVGQNQRAVEVAVASSFKDNGCTDPCIIFKSDKKACTMMKGGENICADGDGCTLYLTNFSTGGATQPRLWAYQSYFYQDSDSKLWGSEGSVSTGSLDSHINGKLFSCGELEDRCRMLEPIIPDTIGLYDDCSGVEIDPDKVCLNFGGFGRNEGDWEKLIICDEGNTQ